VEDLIQEGKRGADHPPPQRFDPGAGHAAWPPTPPTGIRACHDGVRGPLARDRCASATTRAQRKISSLAWAARARRAIERTGQRAHRRVAGRVAGASTSHEVEAMAPRPVRPANVSLERAAPHMATTASYGTLLQDAAANSEDQFGTEEEHAPPARAGLLEGPERAGTRANRGDPAGRAHLSELPATLEALGKRFPRQPRAGPPRSRPARWAKLRRCLPVMSDVLTVLAVDDDEGKTASICRCCSRPSASAWETAARRLRGPLARMCKDEPTRRDPSSTCLMPAARTGSRPCGATSRAAAKRPVIMCSALDESDTVVRAMARRRGRLHQPRAVQPPTSSRRSSSASRPRAAARAGGRRATPRRTSRRSA